MLCFCTCRSREEALELWKRNPESHVLRKVDPLDRVEDCGLPDVDVIPGSAARLRQHCPNRKLLSQCEWDFCLFDSPEQVPEQFWDDRGESRVRWSRIFVPMSWECAGFGSPVYTNQNYPFPFQPPLALTNGDWFQVRETRSQGAASCPRKEVQLTLICLQ